MELTAEEKAAFGKSRTTGDRPPNIRHGRYVLMIDKWFLLRGFRNVLSDIHNFIVVKAEPNTVVIDGKPVTDIPNEVGSRCGAAFKHEGNSLEMARINGTRFTLAVLGLNDAEISEDDKTEAWMRMTNDDPKKFVGEKVDGTDIVIPSINPCRGMIVAAETTPVVTKAEKNIVGITWSNIAPAGEGVNGYVEAAKRWAEYESKLKVA